MAIFVLIILCSITCFEKSQKKKSSKDDIKDHTVGNLVVQDLIGLKWRSLKVNCHCKIASGQAKN